MEDCNTDGMTQTNATGCFLVGPRGSSRLPIRIESTSHLRTAGTESLVSTHLDEFRVPALACKMQCRLARGIRPIYQMRN